MPKKSPDDYERWLGAAAAVPGTDNPLKVPYEVALAEAAAVAKFTEKYWSPTEDRPGLASVQKRLPQAIAEEIPSLVTAVQLAQTKLLLALDPAVADSGERARFLINELESALEFLLDDGVEEPADEQLARIKEFHSQDGQRSSSLSQALRDWGTLAGTLEARLVEIDEDFDPKMIKEALQLADALAKAGPSPAVAGSSEIRDMTATRNRMLSLLMDRVSQVRRAAARVFRNHPDIARLATSTYERRRRAAARRAKLLEEKKKEEAKKPIG